MLPKTSIYPVPLYWLMNRDSNNGEWLLQSSLNIVLNKSPYVNISFHRINCFPTKFMITRTFRGITNNQFFQEQLVLTAPVTARLCQCNSCSRKRLERLWLKRKGGQSSAEDMNQTGLSDFQWLKPKNIYICLILYDTYYIDQYMLQHLRINVIPTYNQSHTNMILTLVNKIETCDLKRGAWSGWGISRLYKNISNKY